jgi:hypothetical protein
MNDYAVSILGVACLGIDGELFVRGALGIASLDARVSGCHQCKHCCVRNLRPGIVSHHQCRNVVNVALLLAVALVIFGIQPRNGRR